MVSPHFVDAVKASLVELLRNGDVKIETNISNRWIPADSHIDFPWGGYDKTELITNVLINDEIIYTHTGDYDPGNTPTNNW